MSRHTKDGYIYYLRTEPNLNPFRPTEVIALNLAMRGKPRDPASDSRYEVIKAHPNATIRTIGWTIEPERDRIEQIAERLNERGQGLAVVDARQGMGHTSDPFLIAHEFNRTRTFRFDVTPLMVRKAQDSISKRKAA